MKCWLVANFFAIWRAAPEPDMGTKPALTQANVKTMLQEIDLAFNIIIIANNSSFLEIFWLRQNLGDYT